MAKGLITRRGTSIEKAVAPIINFISSNTTSITFTIKNNDSETAVILWERDDSTPDLNSLELAPGATSSNLTVGSLTEGTLVNIYATANITSKIKSDVSELVRGTTLSNPTINEVSNTSNSITFTIRNNSNTNARVFYGFNNPPTENFIDLNPNTTSNNITLSGLSGTSVTLFAQTTKDFYTSSGVVNKPFSLIAYLSASGGSILEYNSGGKRYRSHTFTSSGNFTVNSLGTPSSQNEVDYLIIAGGGGTSNSSDPNRSGGGGAGGYRATLSTSGGNSSSEGKVAVNTGTYTITIGAGGSTQGVNSSALGITSTGGGASGSPVVLNNKNGGSGGGGAAQNSNGRIAGTGIAGQGTNGGDGTTASTGGRGGGGGGAGQAGATGASTAKGGDGLSNTLRTGSNETRAGGGGGGADGGSGNYGAGGSGGAGGGGNGAFSTVNIGNGNGVGLNGSANTGSGGGGNGGTCCVIGVSGGSNGGSGIVVIRYEISPS